MKTKAEIEQRIKECTIGASKRTLTEPDREYLKALIWVMDYDPEDDSD